MTLYTIFNILTQLLCLSIYYIVFFLPFSCVLLIHLLPISFIHFRSQHVFYSSHKTYVASSIVGHTFKYNTRRNKLAVTKTSIKYYYKSIHTYNRTCDQPVFSFILSVVITSSMYTATPIIRFSRLPKHVSNHFHSKFHFFPLVLLITMSCNRFIVILSISLTIQYVCIVFF